MVKMKSLDTNTIILKMFPLAVDCINGHLGPEVESEENEIADDRYYKVKVKRCGHCNVPLSSEYV